MNLFQQTPPLTNLHVVAFVVIGMVFGGGIVYVVMKLRGR